MSKVGLTIIVVAAVVFVYLFLLAVVPVVVSIVATTNATIAASSNWSDYPGSQAALVGWPWLMFFVPVSVGIYALLLILKPDIVASPKAIYYGVKGAFKR